MDAEKIIQDLNHRFAAPLPEFYKRRIIVWHDEDQEFVDKISEIELTSAKIVTLTESNNFCVKKLLNFVHGRISLQVARENFQIDIAFAVDDFDFFS